MSRYHDLDGGGVYAPLRGEPAGPGTTQRLREPDRAGRGGGRRPGRPRRAGRSSRFLPPLAGRSWLSIAAVTMTVVLVIGSLSLYLAYRNVADSIRHDNVTAAMLGKRPPKLDGSLNVLVIGSDSRAGTHGQYGTGIYGSRSDTSMLLHISPDHSEAVVVSFPRDSMVPVLSCLPDGQGHPGQQAAPGQSEMLNATFSYGGAACLWKTLEQTTGIHIDHFVEVNFSGFKSIVNDVGGVKVCLPFPIKDPASGLNLTAGVHNIGGAQALAFVRERHVGLGSDLQRIQRQQYFLASAMQKIKQTSILGDPARLYQIVHDVARSLTTDSGLTLTTMVAIANSMRGLSSGHLQFISVPVVPDPADPAARVDWAQPQASQLFRAIASDNHLARALRRARRHPHGSGNGAAHAKKARPVPTVAPSQVQVDVLDGSGTAGVAGSTAATLTSRGFNVVGEGNAPNFSYTSTVIEYGSAADLPAVSTLKAQLGQAQVQQSAALSPGTIDLILGSDFTGLLSGKARKAGGGSAVSSLSKSYGGISGNANICKDSAAFAGPDTPSMFAP
jgi:LCP family protein required for cell wall assembly